MKSRIIDLLEVQDTLKSPFQFLFHGRRNIHFPLGIVLSLLINIASICLSVTLLLELLNHSKPSVNYAKFLSSMTTNMTLNSKELLFTIAFRDKNYQLINDPSIATLIATYERTITINGDIKIEIIDLDFMNCSNVFPLFKEFGVDNRFNSTGLINYNCYNYSEPIIIGGKYGTEFYGNLAFYIAKCRNSTDSNITCKTEEEIDDLIQKGWLQITYVSSYVDFNNYSNPIQYVTEDTYIMFDVLMNKKMYIYFSPLEIHSENNIIFSNQNTEIATKHDITTTDIISVLDNGIISSIMVCPSFTVDKYYRRYIKIQEIGASIGGLYSGLSVIAIVLSTFHKHRYIEMKIINEVFTFSSESVLKEKSLFKIQPFLNLEKKISNINDNSSKNKKQKKSVLCLPIKLPNNNICDLGQEIKSSKLYYYKIDIGFCKALKLILCFCKSETKNNYKEYQFALRELLKYIDYVEVSKLFMDIERIKTILKSQNISEKWVSQNKLILMNLNNNEIKDVSKMANSTILFNSNMYLAGDNKGSDFLDILKK